MPINMLTVQKKFKDIYRISKIHISNIGYRQNDSNTRAIVFK